MADVKFDIMLMISEKAKKYWDATKDIGLNPKYVGVNRVYVDVECLTLTALIMAIPHAR